VSRTRQELARQQKVRQGSAQGIKSSNDAKSHAPSLVGIHMTDVPFYHAFRKPDDATADEKKYLEHIAKFGQTQDAYALIQGAR